MKKKIKYGVYLKETPIDKLKNDDIVLDLYENGYWYKYTVKIGQTFIHNHKIIKLNSLDSSLFNKEYKVCENQGKTFTVLGYGVIR